MKKMWQQFIQSDANLAGLCTSEHIVGNPANYSPSDKRENVALSQVGVEEVK